MIKDYTKLTHEHEMAINTIVVNWCLSNVCNYNCSYCPNYLHDSTTGWPDMKDVMSFCHKIIDHHESKNIYFEFTGGEVSLWKKFPDVVSFLKLFPNVYTGLISNGSPGSIWWDEMTGSSRLDHVCLSFHPEKATREKVAHFIEVVETCSKYMRTHINIMMHPDYFDRELEMADYLSRFIKNISIALQPLLVDFKDELFNYSKEQLTILDRQHELYGSKIKHDKEWPIFRGAMKVLGGKKELVSSAHRFIADGANRWTGWKCYAGVEQMVVDIAGRVWRGWCKEGGCLGTASACGVEDIDIPNEPWVCNRDYCHCNFDIMCTKEKI